MPLLVSIHLPAPDRLPARQPARLPHKPQRQLEFKLPCNTRDQGVSEGKKKKEKNITDFSIHLLPRNKSITASEEVSVTFFFKAVQRPLKFNVSDFSPF